MDFTSRMVTLLGELRRQRNGAVADAMYAYGVPLGLNYGVSLPTVRRMARALTPDHAFAAYLYLQDVRELRLAALHIAQPERIVAADIGVWAAGIVNSEIAEEAAFALLWRLDSFPGLFDEWTASGSPLLQYAALLAGARAPQLGPAWIAPALDAVRHTAAADSLESSDAALSYSTRLVARGAVALLAACAARNEENRQAVIRAAGSLGSLPAEDFILEELAWRLEA